MEICARIPVYTITTAIGLEGDEALRFRHAHVNSVENSQRSSARALQEHDAGRGNPARPHQGAGGQIRQTISSASLIAATLREPGVEPRPMTEREIMHMAKIVMIAGGGTSWRQMGITLLRAAHQPGPACAGEGRPRADR
jgi:cytochrome P450